jgi:hypothetical protein
VSNVRVHASAGAPGTYLVLPRGDRICSNMWVRPIVLKAVGALTVTACAVGATAGKTLTSVCDAVACAEQGGVCRTTSSGYLPVCVTGATLGVIWLACNRDRARHLQSLPKEAWAVTVAPSAAAVAAGASAAVATST